MPSDTTTTTATASDQLAKAEQIHAALNGREIRRGCVAMTRVWVGGANVRVYCSYRLTTGGASPRAHEAGYLDLVIDEEGDVVCSMEHLTREEYAFDSALDATVYAK